MSTRVLLIGGFLGAGKTTLITRLAKELHESGKTVALICNDQGESLVDTQYSKAMGLEVAEVLRGCFCCRFQDFIMSARSLVSASKPDFILAEPVGSCTDLLATVVAPLKLMYPKEFQVGPLMILVDVSWLASGKSDSDSINNYLRKHQIEEGDIIILSKMDLVPKEVLPKLVEAIGKLNRDARIISYSAKTGEGLQAILEIAASHEVSRRTPVEVDYDIYAQAEAELGWYNGTYQFSLGERADAYDLAIKVLKAISMRYGEDEIAHVKLMMTSESNALKMNLVGGTITVDGVKGSRYGKGEATLTVNARVVSPPSKLQAVVREAVESSLVSIGASMESFKDTCFSPSRPQPTYRMTAPES